MIKEIIGIDYETTGFNPYTGDRIFAFCITNEDIETKVWRFDWKDTKRYNESRIIFDRYHSSKYIKVAHNAKFEMGFTSMYYDGKLPYSQWEDTMIMSQLLRNLLKSHSLENLAKKYFTELYPDESEEWAFYDKQVKLHVTKQKRLFNNYQHRLEKEIFEPMHDDGIKPFITDRENYGLVPLDIMNKYQTADGDRCMLLYTLMYNKLLKDKALFNDYQNEMKLIYATQKMEQVGMMVHSNNAKKLYNELSKKLTILESKKRKLFGFEINLDSADQIQKHLFGYINRKKHSKIKQGEEWKKHEPRFRMQPQLNTSTGAPSASKEALELLVKAYPKNKALDLLSQWRAYGKGRSMVRGYLELMSDESIVHPNIMTNEAKTGRQSVRQPSLQNVQKEFSIKSLYGIPGRRCFRPRPGYVYFLGDYSGIEMRMIINAAGEEVLIEKLKENPDYDVHTFNANHMYGEQFINEEDPKTRKDLRAHVKDAGFGLPYGASLATFSHSLGVDIKRGKEILRNYAEVCPGISSFNRTKMTEVRSKGYITTAFGRKLFIWKDKAYTAANYQIQGDAAGTLKRAQVAIDEYLRKVWNYEIRMILPVHDEIIIEYPRYLLPEWRCILHDLNWCMINIPEIEVPLMTEWKIAKNNWQDAEEVMI